MLELGSKTLIAYLLGTVLGSLVLGPLWGVDIRRQGSGNAGATNALRTQGRVFGLLVLLVDIAKGVVAVRWVPDWAIPGVAMDLAVSRQWLVSACGFAVILGHVYPVWFGFRGGKGVATVVGVFAAVQPWSLLPLLSCWLVVLLLTGYVGLASMTAGVGLVAAVAWREPGNGSFLIFCAAITVFVIYTHRGNIRRMRTGTENRARLWLFRPRTI